MTPAPDTDESVARARTRDFQTRHGESFWDTSQDEFEVITKRLEDSSKLTGGQHDE